MKADLRYTFCGFALADRRLESRNLWTDDWIILPGKSSLSPGMLIRLDGKREMIIAEVDLKDDRVYGWRAR